MSKETVMRQICDSCGEKEDKQTSPLRIGGYPFRGWVGVVINGTSIIRHGDSGDFCSIKCALIFLQRLREKEVKNLSKTKKDNAKATDKQKKLIDRFRSLGDTQKDNE